MRVKTVTIEDQQFTISPLTMEQVEALVDGEQPTANDAKAWRARAWKTVCQGLTNANPGVTQSPEVLRRTMDLPTFNGLHAAILEFSGLRSAVMGEGQPAPGAASTSGISAVA